MLDKAMRKPYADYNFYSEVYHGTIATAENFDNAELEAEAFVNTITFGRIERMDDIPDEAKYAVCSVTDAMVKFSESRKNNVASESNDGYSVTYASGVTDADCNREMQSRARRWLANTGLMYRGWSKKYDA